MILAIFIFAIAQWFPKLCNRWFFSVPCEYIYTGPCEMSDWMAIASNNKRFISPLTARYPHRANKNCSYGNIGQTGGCIMWNLSVEMLAIGLLMWSTLINISSFDWKSLKQPSNIWLQIAHVCLFVSNFPLSDLHMPCQILFWQHAYMQSQA